MALATTRSLACGTATAAPAGPAQAQAAADKVPHDAMDAVAAMQPGWNLGNTLDAIPDETSWGVWALYQSADRIFSSRQEPFLVTETNAQAISGTSENRSAFDGQWRQAAWALVSRGARMIEYWHWHTLHFGAETYWGGILPHSGKRGRVYTELACLGAEFATAGAVVAGIEPDADIAMLYSMPSKWLMQKYPSLAKVNAR